MPHSRGSLELDAPEFQRRREENLVNELKNLDFVKKDAKPCPTCGMAISKSAGCNKMTCSNCGQYFCFKCGKRIDGYLHFSNSCTLFDDDDRGENAQLWQLVQQQEQRQQQRQEAIRFGKPCPSCGQPNVKVGNNNHIFCMSCQNHYCGQCHKLVRKSSEHFGPNKCASVLLMPQATSQATTWVLQKKRTRKIAIDPRDFCESVSSAIEKHEDEQAIHTLLCSTFLLRSRHNGNNAKRKFKTKISKNSGFLLASGTSRPTRLHARKLLSTPKRSYKQPLNQATSEQLGKINLSSSHNIAIRYHHRGIATANGTTSSLPTMVATPILPPRHSLPLRILPTNDHPKLFTRPSLIAATRANTLALLTSLHIEYLPTAHAQPVPPMHARPTQEQHEKSRSSPARLKHAKCDIK
ncbi:hypothetical protein SELMODRAFT_432613 [Selaginella moellendorffii]|uniref:RBR-type E3 ubiquitin transferase n=1 Tax=Selaginella moellendorffii TaxID=88036 RepID=D8TGJ4_SELML|nr:hypothetical protein SELMODRAFT_432613 [Selaginella moellendorffii]